MITIVLALFLPSHHDFVSRNVRPPWDDKLGHSVQVGNKQCSKVCRQGEGERSTQEKIGLSPLKLMKCTCLNMSSSDSGGNVQLQITFAKEMNITWCKECLQIYKSLSRPAMCLHQLILTCLIVRVQKLHRVQRKFDPLISFLTTYVHVQAQSLCTNGRVDKT